MPDRPHEGRARLRVRHDAGFHGEDLRQRERDQGALSFAVRRKATDKRPDRLGMLQDERLASDTQTQHRPRRVWTIDPIADRDIEASGELFLSAFRYRRHSSRWVAIAAAYLLVLQAVFAGMASGAHAGGMRTDDMPAMTLCAPGEMPPGTNSDKGAPQHDQTSCCILGCALSGGGEPAAPGAYLPVSHRAIDLIAFARHLDAPHGYVAGRSPANPRAPPSEI